MTVPAWLANVEWEMAVSRREPRNEYWLTLKDGSAPIRCTPERLQLELLDWMSGPVNRWLDVTRIHGNREARRLWARICRCYLSFACFVCLRGQENGALTRIVETCVRLNGLRLTPWTPKPMREAY